MTQWAMSYDWAGPLGEDQIAHLQAVVDATDPAVLAAVERWLAVLDRDSVRDLPGEVYGDGGATVTVGREVAGQLAVSLRSGGQDAFDSISFSADSLHDAVTDGGGAAIRWVELPYEPAIAGADSVADDAHMISMLPCPDIDEIERFWTALGLRVTYRQRRPNPYLALGLGGIDLHYYGLPGHDPEQSHSTCGIVVSDTEPLHARFAEGFRSAFGAIPQSGAPRMTRPRTRANNDGLSGFSVIDPAGNWIRVSRRPSTGRESRSDDDRGILPSVDGGPLARALENAVVLGDSRGDAQQAHKILAGALGRAQDAAVGERASALAYLAELRVRLGDHDGARAAAAELTALAERDGLTQQDRAAVETARREVAELDLSVGET